VQFGDDRAHLVAGQDDGEVFRALGPDHAIKPGQVLLQDVAVEEQERAQRLVLGGGRDFALDGQGTEEARDLGGAHVGGMALAVEEDVPADPSDVRLLGAAAAVAEAVGFADAVEELGRAGRGRAGLRHDEGRVRRSGIPHALVGLERHSARRIVPGGSRRKSRRIDTVSAARRE